MDLSKVSVGQKVNLSKESEDLGNVLKEVKLGLGWDVNENKDSAKFDADVSVLGLGSDDKTTKEDFVFYGELENAYMKHSGDNRDGEGDGDDETIIVDLTKVPANVTKLAVYVTIHEAKELAQNFGMLTNSYIRIVNNENDEEIMKFELDFDADTATALRFGTLINRNGSWYFSAEKIAVEDGLEGITKKHGL